MPPSAADLPGEGTPGQTLAVAAQSLYLANLLLLPVLSFLALAWLYASRRKDAPPLALCHLQQTVAASLWAGVLLVGVNALILALGGYDGPNVWTVVIVYFTVFHATLVMAGMYGLAKAMAGQCWRIPLVGRPLPPGCGRGVDSGG
jgi:4-hydroxybenzoate polyprenyltransferase